MSAAAATATAAAPEAPKKKSKKLLFIVLGVVVLAVLGAAAALFILKKNTAEDDYEEDDGHTPVAQAKTSKTAPTFLPLENMVINLADPGGNRFIQLGLTLQLQDAVTETAVKSYLPSIRSQVLVLISQRTTEELLVVAGKEKLANDIIATISKEMGYAMPAEKNADGTPPRRTRAAPNPVQAVLFSSFIIQ
ncbi:flagellar basal body-associated FliL family protein [Hydrogenophaga sp. BPS33]|uniref:flagellar basal body-associated FliL family protein n=1 Tax=Hydrogenophaga sp. BPS33 TaxID=2651974 RepID=UPI00132051E0|nr:flagellar basal body-associated FliL family protein [Hydrogenophaga sp. BPS33]QHE88104.1 flagellar basal body protein FliL [Hydrogenophaga sp. BPS33]